MRSEGVYKIYECTGTSYSCPLEKNNEGAVLRYLNTKLNLTKVPGKYIVIYRENDTDYIYGIFFKEDKYREKVRNRLDTIEQEKQKIKILKKIGA